MVNWPPVAHSLSSEIPSLSGAAGLGGHVWLEGAGQDVGRKPGAIVLYCQTSVAQVTLRVDRDARPFDLRHRLLRILQQVVDHLPQTRLITLDLRQRLV